MIGILNHPNKNVCIFVKKKKNVCIFIKDFMGFKLDFMGMTQITAWAPLNEYLGYNKGD